MRLPQPILKVAGLCFLFGVTLVVALPECRAECGRDATKCAWHRTCFAYNSLDRPLRGYFVPRPEMSCDIDDYTSGCGQDCTACGWPVAETSSDSAVPMPRTVMIPPLHAGLEPAGFDRLGQIPNTMEMGVGRPSAGGPPPRAAH